MLRRKGDRNNFILGFRRDSICAPMLDRGTFFSGRVVCAFPPRGFASYILGCRNGMSLGTDY